MSRATASLTGTALDELRKVASTRNTRSDVTGLLLHDGARFIQALEGPEAPVRAIIASIARDPRHEWMTYMFDGAAVGRQFGHWSMDVCSVDAADPSSAFVAAVKRRVEEVSDPRIKAIFIGFAAMTGRR